MDAARKKAVDSWYCIECRRPLGMYSPNTVCRHCSDKEGARIWADDVLENAEQYVILDTETTGLFHNSEIVQIAILSTTGTEVLNTLVKPAQPEALYEKNEGGLCAFDIHGIGAERLVDAPMWSEVWPLVCAALRGKRLLIYNASFDIDRLKAMCRIHTVAYEEVWQDVECIMIQYSTWVNEWSNYWEDYRWQPLMGSHDALGDCRAALWRIHEMARDGDKSGESSSLAGGQSVL